MTDTEQKRIEAICKVAHIDDISDLSDGYHPDCGAKMGSEG